ncbi:5-(carboxyamino)imidazole ribonucleotide synthase [Aphanothece sacrum]|uniref:N5-carboxyaminoimidazole ribonucleotide synthase n=1 Tax=Aphanothece sacrum FPU1 TaxID=1920663 RepID=A0A401IGU0_APHSA|nr:5-(carboxyamino)imidazole ribonucleotide synthase [Aphanothece sacrum]GBF80507.1 phosphoribosylaminoimidazole carboxylase [Aphanothece sacrum FPU1]GBF85898.1 phosphoribosylaminoimidazole carboxylase [Aphanothece sacrum FPU3]
MMVKRVGVIGGGQLAWMMADAAQRLGVELVIQTPFPDDPAVSIAHEVVFAPIDNAIATAQLAQGCDIITFENEFINLVDLQQLEQQGVCFRPSLAALSPLLDKYQQRSYLQKINLPVPDFTVLDDSLSVRWPFPVVVKARRHGYDGQGTFIIKTPQELEKTRQAFSSITLMVEEFIPFERELAVMAARSVTGEVVVYPVTETYQKNQVCHWAIAPANITPEIQAQVTEIASHLLTQLQVVGIFGIELFLTSEGQLLVNEIAPRTHNSGHYTLDACNISQFEMQLRAVMGLPLCTPELICQGAVMINLLGYEHSNNDYREKRQKMSSLPQTYVHWYGKKESRQGRKLGHVTVLLEEVIESEIKRQEALLNRAKQIESIWYS